MMTYMPEQLLPHKPPMIFISAVESADIAAGKLSARIDIKETDVLYQADVKGVPGYAALEYMAQAIGCYVGLYDLERDPNSAPGVGFVLGTRKLAVHTEVFELGKSYMVDVSLLFYDDNIASFECIIRNGDVQLAEAALNVYRPTNINQFMEDYT